MASSISFSIAESKVPEKDRKQFIDEDEMLADIEKELRYIAENKTSRKSNYYIDTHEFAAEIVKCKIDGQLSDKAVKMFQTLIFHVQRGWRYNDPEKSKDVAANAMVILLSNWQKYDPARNHNAFAFFTTVVLNGLRQGWHNNTEPGIRITIDALFTNNKDD